MNNLTTYDMIVLVLGGLAVLLVVLMLLGSFVNRFGNARLRGGQPSGLCSFRLRNMCKCKRACARMIDNG